MLTVRYLYGSSTPRAFNKVTNVGVVTQNNGDLALHLETTNPNDLTKIIISPADLLSIEATPPTPPRRRRSHK